MIVLVIVLHLRAVRLAVDLQIQPGRNSFARHSQIDDQGRVYVTDYLLGRIQVFDNDGKFLWSWGNKSVTKSLFQNPVTIALDGNGQFYVVNQRTNNVQVFDMP